MSAIPAFANCTLTRTDRRRKALLAPAVAPALAIGPILRAGALPIQAPDSATATQSKHAIVVIGENHTFDNVVATYPPHANQGVKMLSKAS